MDGASTWPLRLAPGTLVVLSGAAGCGKSTFARAHFPPEAILSSDQLRQELLGDAASQDRPELVFGRLQAELRRRLAAGEPTVVDTTAARRSARRRLVEAAREAGRPAILVVFDISIRECQARNARRGRVVPPDRVAHQHQTISMALKTGFRDEGFERVLVLREPDVARARFILPDAPAAPVAVAAAAPGAWPEAERPPVKVRGIYATALTVILRDRGFPIAEPSPVMRERLGLEGAGTPLATLRDLPDGQGMAARGDPAASEFVCAVLAQALSGAIPYRFEGLRALEFSGLAKAALDRARATILPTLPGHHRLKAMDSGQVDRAEEGLDPARAGAVAAGLEEELLAGSYRPGERIEVQHVKPWSPRLITLRGELERREGGRVDLRRSFRPGGTYDSLDAPILPGDRGSLELRASAWVSRRAYWRADGREIGELYNVQTPTELYRGRVRYVDLEIDVMRLPGQPPRIVDEDDLERAERGGQVPADLVAMARRVAQRLAERLAAGDDEWWEAGPE